MLKLKGNRAEIKDKLLFYSILYGTHETIRNIIEREKKYQ